MTAVPNPAVSILMAVHNGARWLPETMETLLGQTYRDFELVIVDDASCDDTPRILHEYAERDDRVVLLRNEENRKLAASLNRGLKQCRAPWVARADADDLYVPRRLEKQMAFLGTRPEIGVFSSWYHKMRSDGTIIDLTQLPIEDTQIKFTLLWESPLCHPVSMYSRDLILEAGGYDETFWTAQDYELWVRLARRTRFANMPEPLMKVRYHEGSTIAKRGEKGALLGNSISQKIIAEYTEMNITLDHAVSLKRFLSAHGTLTSEEYGVAVPLVTGFLQIALKRESPDVLPWIRNRFAAAALKHSRMLSYANAGLSRTLLKKAVIFSPSILRDREFSKQIARLAILGPWRRLRTGGRTSE